MNTMTNTNATDTTAPMAVTVRSFPKAHTKWVAEGELAYLVFRHPHSGKVTKVELHSNLVIDGRTNPDFYIVTQDHVISE